MSRFICIHGHFYQPPRENPWLETIEPQDSAAPFHDWNERILAECYEPNTASRILDDENRIISIVNNYARISFDFGPTLLSWMERAAPACYEAILEADRESQRRFSGHGSAMAQIYNHVIMPLATDRDQEIQVAWGLRDFERRFGRVAEGMWLSETAVDTRALEALARHGVRFTVLSPGQARSVRPLGAREWRGVSSEHIDTTRPYVKRLPSGRSIAIFFYDGAASKAIAFEGLLHRGENFANRLLSEHSRDKGVTLTHVATDGESYGHHHPHGDMALAYALDVITRHEHVDLTNYGEFLERFPPQHEVEIVENSSWSCAHGVERWRSDCGCHTGGPAGWNQSWRAPLRQALDALRDAARGPAHRALGELLDDPERAVLDYIDVILDRSKANVDAFLTSRGVTDARAQVRTLKLLELERQLQLMYTSCGWFFNDLAGIETVQVLRYLGRAVQLGEDVLGQRLEPAVLEILGQARSNRPQAGTGQDLYATQVLPSKMTWEMLGAHYGISSLFKTNAMRLYCYDIAPEVMETREMGRSRLLLGRARLTSSVTRSSERLGFAVYHGGEHHVTAGVERVLDDALAAELVEPFLAGDSATLVRRLDDRYGTSTFDLHSLFGDEQRQILDVLLRATLEEAENAHRHIYEHHWGVVRFLAELEVPLPEVLSVAAEVVLNARLRRALGETPADPVTIGNLVREAVTEGVTLDEATLAFTAGRSLEAMAEGYFATPGDPEKLAALEAQVRLVRTLPFEVDLWRIQNAYFQQAKSPGSELPERFGALGDALTIRLLP